MLFLSNWEILLRLAAATALGVLFGFERNKSAKPVGIRTHVLISLSACVIAILSAYGFTDHEVELALSMQQSAVRADPARLVVGVLSGIGFIGAGIIWKTPSGSVHGITTAAEIFLLAALGIGLGMGMYFLVAAATVIAIINMAAERLRRRYQKRWSRRGKNPRGSKAKEAPEEGEEQEKAKK